MATKNRQVFDPVKQVSAGQKVVAVKWSTEALNKAKDGIRKGLPLKANPFLNNDIQLLKPDLVFERTREEIEEYRRCMNDVVYFSKYCYLMTPTGLKQCVLRDYQKDYLEHLKKHPFSIFLSCRQSGKSTTTAIECLHAVIFSVDYKGLVLSKSGAAGRDLVKKMKDMYRYLPDFLKPGIYKWNVSEMSFDNNSGIYTEAFSETAGLGSTLNFLILDEFAWCPPSQVELFYNNVIPTITTMPNAKVRIMSTQNGHNFFYRLWQLATVGDPKTGKKSGYGTFKVDWWQVPNYNPKTQQWEKRTDEWKKKMISVLGTEENFDYQYGTTFYSSDRCILTRSQISDLHRGERVWEPWAEDAESEIFANLTRECDWIYDRNEDWIVLLCDLAEGSGGDFTVFQILQWDGEGLRQRAMWRSNSVSLEESAGVLYNLLSDIFNPEHTLLSIEWNTYGALFYHYLMEKLDTEDDEEFDTGCVVWYPKGTDQVDSFKGFAGKKIPGLRMTASVKKSSCMLLKNEFTRDRLTITDAVTISEIENFEETSAGSYAAARGHDDTVMPLVQIPRLKETPKWTEFLDAYEEFKMVEKISDSYYNPFDFGNTDMPDLNKTDRRRLMG